MRRRSGLEAKAVAMAVSPLARLWSSNLAVPGTLLAGPDIGRGEFYQRWAKARGRRRRGARLDAVFSRS
jgi:hypothetical protein